ncbi:MAG TPA: DUF3182 family protein [Ramlibacter sp.]|uniref:DUF3182 family protein n=1 Tax=Ramlibacter sp. TaxID=1917967 RepID=UPI002ED006B3
MAIDQHFPGTRGIVVAHIPDPNDHASEHERCTLREFARRIARLRGDVAGGFFDPALGYDAPLYFVPSSTLTARQAQALGIAGLHDLFGGVVPHAFVATKAISHPLVDADARAVEGWSRKLGASIADAVLPGYTVFAREDALAAGRRLLAAGPLRLKPVRASGGRGQSVVRREEELRAALDAMDRDEIERHGLVLEGDLEEESTFSVGQVQVGDLVATYYGFQRLTPNNEGHQVFGGSDLTVARGGFDALLACNPAPKIRHAIEQARRYDAAVRACFPGFYASRSNYDILLGRDAAGTTRSAVLEQSWRAGGATGPEIAALECFRAEPDRRLVRASCYEVFGDSPEPPARATVYYRGDDPHMGRVTKYTIVRQDDDARQHH